MQRSLRDMHVVAAEYMAHLSDAVSSTTLTHVAYLLLLMQIMSQVLTALIGDSHSFWSDARNRSLDTAQLLRAPPVDLLRQAATQTDGAFWNSAEVQEWYWPLHLRVLLRSGELGERPGTMLAFRLRVNTVGKMVRRLSQLLDSTLADFPRLNKHTVLPTLALKLSAFTRNPRPRALPEDDIDPALLLARDFHQHQFAGVPGAMGTSVAAMMQDVLGRIGSQFGPRAQAAVSLAAHQAGITNAAKFYVGSHGDDDDATLSAVSSFGGGVLDTPRFVLTQLPVLDVLNVVLTRMRDAVDEEAAFDALMEVNDDLDHSKIVAGKYK